ncbi:hypothetical protein LEAN103870_00645 [Legionella anisa]|uniref:Uncharacterized protein n=1 Tax=Legionella anisa TaxID=28082 RepID=A0AAX0WUY9_9GAMM|nr:hypothetical protein [Legionella anisa]AWN73906.1 hypothetical protein DLD14_08705 [Legionella anisa]KTC67175.1 hypothetical protein Lani_3520 [Legionella anisa]MBN5937096.1 hypothetical protein [Legionella anisa]MCW8426171.1 hypothetical protein [Legionella anisa]MCW8448482.1 hypothetical protein [Legionella anisa]
MKENELVCEKSLTKIFENGLNSQEKISGETVVNATELVIQAIVAMDVDEEYKKAIAEACIEAASLIDPERCVNKASIVETFQSNLERELANLSRSIFTLR